MDNIRRKTTCVQKGSLQRGISLASSTSIVMRWTNKKSEFVKEFSIKSGERTLSQLAISNLNYIIKSVGEFFYHGFIFPHVFQSQLPSFVSQEVTTTLCMHNIEVFWNSQFLRFNKVPCYSTKHLKKKSSNRLILITCKN